VLTCVPARTMRGTVRRDAATARMRDALCNGDAAKPRTSSRRDGTDTKS